MNKLKTFGQCALVALWYTGRLIVIYFGAIFLIAFWFDAMNHVVAQDAKQPAATVDATKKATPPPKHIAITKAELGDAYANAYKNLEARRKAVEESLAWQQYIISQNQLQSTTLFIMAEMGIKPSEECKPIERDGKLLYFECPVKTEEKSKP